MLLTHSGPRHAPHRRRAFALMAALLLPMAANADTALRRRLEAMYASDQDLRAQIVALQNGGSSDPAALQALWRRQEAIDAANLAALREIVREHGWPRRSAVGNRAATAAFLVVQHADLATQEEFLPQLRDAATAGEAGPDDLALLEDRINVTRGLPQRYGTQVVDDGRGGQRLAPIADPAHVDARRRAVGLPPLAQYAREMGVPLPADDAQR